MAYKREHILVVAEELFGDKGFDGTSVRDDAAVPVARLRDVLQQTGECLHQLAKRLAIPQEQVRYLAWTVGAYGFEPSDATAAEVKRENTIDYTTAEWRAMKDHELAKVVDTGGPHAPLQWHPEGVPKPS